MLEQILAISVIISARLKITKLYRDFYYNILPVYNVDAA